MQGFSLAEGKYIKHLLNMNYRKIYNDIMDRARLRTNIGYVEKHHIIPRCMGGSDNPINLVSLTPEEHYVAHQLLVKIYPTNRKLVFAIVRMSGKQKRGNNKLYGWLRRKLVAELSKPKSEEHKKKMSLAKIGKKQSLEHIAKRMKSLKTSSRHRKTTKPTNPPRRYLKDMTPEEAKEYWKEKDRKKQEKKDRISITAVLYSIL